MTFPPPQIPAQNFTPSFPLPTGSSAWSKQVPTRCNCAAKPCMATSETRIERCVAACQNSATQLFINDHWREAIAAGAYGIHLGQEDMDTADLAAIAAAGLRLGLSTHSVAELDRALSVHPSYVASGAIFPTTTKQMPTAPQGLDKLREYVRQARGTPVVAIGGIDLNNAEDVLATGVSSLAVVRAVTEAENPEAVVKAFQALWDE